MFRKLFLVLAILVAGCVPATEPDIAPVAASGASSGQILAASTPFPGSVVRLAWFYKPPSQADAATLAGLYDTFILTKLDEDFRNQLVSAGVREPILQYLRFSAIMDPGDCASQPYRNQVADQPGDFCRISAGHPDWFLLDAHGSRIYSASNYPAMDPNNPGWRAFWLERARLAQETLGWQGVFLDNVEGSLGKQERLAGGKTIYASDAAYQDAVAGFLEYLYSGYFHPQQRPLYANIIETRDPLVWNRYLQFLDGAMLEDFALGWDSYLNPFEWEQHMRMAETAQAQGKYAILVSQGAQNDLARQQFAFASYLLVANGFASFRYADADYYDEAWMYENYRLALGAPLGMRYQEGGAWRRDFENGTVSVDPAWHTTGIELKP